MMLLIIIGVLYYRTVLIYTDCNAVPEALYLHCLFMALLAYRRHTSVSLASCLRREQSSTVVEYTEQFTTWIIVTRVTHAGTGKELRLLY